MTALPHLFLGEGDHSSSLGRHRSRLQGLHRNIGAVFGDPKCQSLSMAQPLANNQQSPPRVDGRTASDSESNNRRNNRNHATSSRHRSP
ncbi:hypothetical protein PIB30_067725 [Stylosanthes scabra]|uniref:Uncharacterized protein n=1 Tax=Stylosanthes scabra TaxID=79078 RepID=A0ABU6TNL3_9FABA|nr:hypothetical protein [Stylosanthes scabra]